MLDSARSLHRSWLAALTLRSQSSPTTTPDPAAPADNDNPSHGGGGEPPVTSRTTMSSSDTGHGAEGGGRRVGGWGPQGEEERHGRRRRRRSARGGVEESWLRAQLIMPVWPFSDDVHAEEGFAVDPGGYWGLSGGGDGDGNGYQLWRIPPAECAWQGAIDLRRGRGMVYLWIFASYG